VGLHKGPPADTGPCKVCQRPRGVAGGHEPFLGRVCRSCYNRKRRERYRYDPENRAKRSAQRQASYDPDKQRERMRRYRAAQRKTTSEGS
jgi:hypothetical protein